MVVCGGVVWGVDVCGGGVGVGLQGCLEKRYRMY